ncbi:hypothetical protein HYX19_02400 [Candidatus Woesearchaeota archaeon]|nr:hypothetical protein [Candidatus Woesearchaeota archaeon]
MTHEIKPLIPVPKLSDERMQELLKEYLLDPPKQKHICLTDRDLPPIEELISDESELTELCNRYIENIGAYCCREIMCNEKFMRSIEKKIGVDGNQKDGFRHQILRYIGSLAAEGKTFDYRKDEQLKKAFTKYLFDRKRDEMNFYDLSKCYAGNSKERLEVIKNRLIKNFGYCEVCAVDALHSYIKRLISFAVN